MWANIMSALLWAAAWSDPEVCGEAVTEVRFTQWAGTLNGLTSRIAGDARFAVDTMELERGGLSFTADTLRALRKRYPAGTADLVLLLGADAAAQFSHWREPGEVRGTQR